LAIRPRFYIISRYIEEMSGNHHLNQPQPPRCEHCGSPGCQGACISETSVGSAGIIGSLVSWQRFIVFAVIVTCFSSILTRVPFNGTPLRAILARRVSTSRGCPRWIIPSRTPPSPVRLVLPSPHWSCTPFTQKFRSLTLLMMAPLHLKIFRFRWWICMEYLTLARGQELHFLRDELVFCFVVCLMVD
jgi:hypothetical protein